MRVIGGVARGRGLKAFKGLSIRPTSDKVREAIFNILPNPSGKNILDLFAGTGAMGIEALSRGGEQCVFVDKNPVSIRVIKRNLEICGFINRATILQMDTSKAINHLGRKGKGFDIIFIDPPYEAGLMGRTIAGIEENHLILSGGIVVAESSKRMVWEGEVKGLKPLDRRVYGDTVVTFYTLKNPPLPLGGE